MITRIAPTPSGFLHLGNAVNVELVSWLASADGTVALRIDDIDPDRTRTEYVEDIFDLLDWMGVRWSMGPRDAQEQAARYSLSLRTPFYRDELIAARDRGLEVYACACSRATVDRVPSGGCPGGCRDRRLPVEPGRTALRVKVPSGAMVRVTDVDVPLDEVMGDFVVWRRDDRPGYQLVSVIEDRDLGTTHVVRGADLLPSSAAQLFLSPYLAADGVTTATYLHHGLVVDAVGGKLSKSQAPTPGALPRDAATRERVSELARTLGRPLGILPAT